MPTLQKVLFRGEFFGFAEAFNTKKTFWSTAPMIPYYVVLSVHSVSGRWSPDTKRHSFVFCEGDILEKKGTV